MTRSARSASRVVVGASPPALVPDDSTSELSRGIRALVAGGVIGKLSGIARELLLAAAFGTTAATAAFRIAQTSTLIPLNLVTGDSLNSAFLPLHGRKRDADPAAAEALYRAVNLAFVAITIVAAAAVICTAPWLTFALAPGLSPSIRSLATGMVRVMAVGMPFFVAGSMTSYLALALGHYRVVSLRSTIQNSCLLIGTAAAAITGHSILLAWGFTVGCVVYSVYGTARVRQLGLLTTRSPWMGWAETAAHIKPMVLLVRGLLLIPVLVQLNEALERIVASFVGVRTVAATEYANFIIDTCVTLIAVPIGLAGLASLRDYSDIRGAVRLRVGALTPALLFAGLPMSVLLAFHARAVVGLLYGRGHFDTLSTLSTATLVQGFAIGLWAQLLGYVYIKVFSATLQTAKQVRAVALGMLAGMATMSVAIPSGRPIFIGLSGSVYGLVVTFVAAHEIGAVRMLGRWIGILLPGCVLMSVPAMLITGSGVVAFSVSSGISLAAWVGYCWAVPGTRAMLRGLRRGPAPGTVPAGDESVTNAQVKARSRR